MALALARLETIAVPAAVVGAKNRFASGASVGAPALALPINAHSAVQGAAVARARRNWFLVTRDTCPAPLAEAGPVDAGPAPAALLAVALLRQRALLLFATRTSVARLAVATPINADAVSTAAALASRHSFVLPE